MTAVGTGLAPDVTTTVVTMARAGAVTPISSLATFLGGMSSVMTMIDDDYGRGVDGGNGSCDGNGAVRGVDNHRDKCSV